MPRIGEYKDHVERYVRTLAAADAQGEEVESWAAASPVEKHWARIESTSGGEGGKPVASFDGLRLRFRTLVTLLPIDHVYLTELAAEYAVAGVWKERAECGGWQTVCNLSGPV
jgi:hypothetical protein